MSSLSLHSPRTPTPSVPPTAPHPHSDWEQLGQHLVAYDELREGVIKQCRGAVGEEGGEG